MMQAEEQVAAEEQHYQEAGEEDDMEVRRRSSFSCGCFLFCFSHPLVLVLGFAVGIYGSGACSSRLF